MLNLDYTLNLVCCPQISVFAVSSGDFDHQPFALEHGMDDDSQDSDLALRLTSYPRADPINADGDGSLANDVAHEYRVSSSIPPPPPSNKEAGDQDFSMVTHLSSSMANPQKLLGRSSEPGGSAHVLSLRGDPLDLSLPRNLSSSSLSRTHLSASPHGGHGHLSPSRAHGHVGTPQHGNGHLSPSPVHGRVSTPRSGMNQYPDDMSDADQEPPNDVTDCNSDEDYEPLKDYLHDLHLSKYFKLLRENQVTNFDVMSGSETAWQKLHDARMSTPQRNGRFVVSGAYTRTRTT